MDWLKSLFLLIFARQKKEVSPRGLTVLLMSISKNSFRRPSTQENDRDADKKSLVLGDAEIP